MGILISGSYKTASTQVILGLAGIIPVSTLIKFNAVKRFYALKQLPFFDCNLHRNIPVCCSIIDSIHFFGLSQFTEIEQAVLPNQIHPANFSQIQYSIVFENEKLPKNSDTLIYWIFTDGSKIRNKVGAGFAIYSSKNPFVPIAESSFQLPDYATVYQAELVGVQMAASFFVDSSSSFSFKAQEGVTYFLIDNKAAIFTSAYPKKKSSSLAFKNNFLIKNAFPDTVSLNYVPAHKGHFGNERADFLTKNGAYIGIAVLDVKWSFGVLELLNKFLKQG